MSDAFSSSINRAADQHPDAPGIAYTHAHRGLAREKRTVPDRPELEHLGNRHAAGARPRAARRGEAAAAFLLAGRAETDADRVGSFARRICWYHRKIRTTFFGSD